MGLRDCRIHKKLAGQDGSVEIVCRSPNGNLIISTSQDLTLRVWDLAIGECKRTITFHTSWVHGVCCSSDRKFIVSPATIGLYVCGT
jgi:WD40 repeat protein